MGGLDREKKKKLTEQFERIFNLYSYFKPLPKLGGVVEKGILNDYHADLAQDSVSRALPVGLQCLCITRTYLKR